jgi:hypothetical protein
VARIVTREQLYGLVWSRPVAHLAREFVISNSGLGKICRRHAIPTPPPGWWAKKAVGKEVRQPPLPDGLFGAGEPVVIPGGGMRLGRRLRAAACREARVIASEADDNTLAPARPSRCSPDPRA